MTAAERATRERLAQGLAEHVTDEAVLDRAAALLAGVEDHDGGGPGGVTRRRAVRTQQPSRAKRAARHRTVADDR